MNRYVRRAVAGLESRQRETVGPYPPFEKVALPMLPVDMERPLGDMEFLNTSAVIDIWYEADLGEGSLVMIKG